jgi:hypothetical protein
MRFATRRLEPGVRGRVGPERLFPAFARAGRPLAVLARAGRPLAVLARAGRPLQAFARAGRLLAVLAACTAVVGWAPSVAGAREFAPSTFLLSRSAAGGLPNGASCCGVVSHDERIGRVMAFESWASDITPGVRYGVANIYAVFRKPGDWAEIGSPWVAGPTQLVSHAIGGRPANGPSWDPMMSGDSADAPHCVAFLSRATNLVHGDRAHPAQALVENLQTRAIQIVSVSSTGRPADRDTTEVAVSGDCRRVAFVSTATDLAQTTTRPGWPAAVTRSPRRGTSQVYVRFLAGSGRLTGLTMVASAADGRPADAAATGVTLSRDGDALAFSSAAGDLGAPSGGVAQIWERMLTPRASRQEIRQTIRLVSRTPDGRPGDAPSMRPTIDHDGRVIAFESLAANLLPGANGASQIIRATVTGTDPVLGWVSQPWSLPELGNGPSHDASITDGGEWIFFDSTAGNLDPGRPAPAGPVQVYRWTVPSLVSPTDETHIARVSVGGPFDFQSRTPASHPDASARGNYIPFESDDPGLDVTLPARREPAWYPGPALSLPDWWTIPAGTRPVTLNLVTLPGVLEGAITPRLPGAFGTPDESAGNAAVDPRLHQAYVRFVGSNG